ncbi:hypothetical protein AVEN_129672-1 [Araneus ventricosus]|uniref:Uncharacterized protein n=1 Tax=Araneus ventricosus TaxID=182803 RepID=A0A4Y2M8C8_ARAVE|nr:hypothetical protein AVEN_129672-1 [Araneus ventricosus]
MVVTEVEKVVSDAKAVAEEIFMPTNLMTLRPNIITSSFQLCRVLCIPQNILLYVRFTSDGGDEMFASLLEVRGDEVPARMQAK